ncbi:MAG TPA: FtsK/SpoIIIE domain-containing protein [Anaerolineae bacterium]|nr:FtsK/SpoIIIE domain-containing protein [Anaerolineae bacterium]HQM14931.1 FtsK/SpoIIIE domain-containing protein [Anaerolineae bacterium]
MPNEDLQISRSRLREAEAIARRLPDVLQRRGLRPAFSDWLVTADHGLTWLFGVLDLRRIERLEQYSQPDLLHHLSTAIGGRPVYLSNSSGLRYAVLLSAPPRLPRRVDFPGVQRGQVLLGQRATGELLRVSWEHLGHLLVAGKTGAGKSSFDRLVAYQALAEGCQLLLADLDGATFPMLAGHPALLAPLAHTPEAMLSVVEQALGECDHRAVLYGQVGAFPENLAEYNAAVVREGGTPLPRVLVVLDEFNTAVLSSGGATGPLAAAVAMLGWRGRKFGFNLIFSAQDFTKAIVGRVRDQVSAAICFRVRGGEVARAVGCPDAVRIPESHPGLAVTDRWGPVQTCYLDKALLVQAGQGGVAPVLTPLEQQVVTQAQQRDGRITLALLQELGLGKREAERLLSDWRVRGWVLKDPARQNAHYLTSKLEALVGNRETRETP